MADDATVEVLAAAGELADFLKQVTGAEFPVVKSGTNRSERQILVGRSPVVDKMVSVDWKALGPEGFVIRTVGSKLVIAGGPRRGTINGVYTFLEDIVGCRWYMPSFSVIPKKPKLALKPLNVRMIPVFGMRWLNFNQSLDWSVRNHLNYFPRNNKKIDLNNPKLAGTNHANGRVVHTLVEDGLLKKAVFDTHPEYFALVKGERVRTAQPCLTNPDLLNHIVRRAKEWIETEDPPGQYISISGGDHPGVCECKPCTKVFKKHGHAGTEMIFVNKVAAELEKDYPDMPVYASAYSFTQWAPRDVKMHKNVMVHYCPIHLCYF
ncbi:MAG: DUF4838 domain-containing protein, partial [Pirellulaceae bacterium]|nr:DUF4838 domain-containing protein [Pirellulaceae bacterium]